MPNGHQLKDFYTIRYEILQVLVYVSASCKIETPCLHFSSDQTHRMEIAKKSNQQLISVENPTAV